MNPLFIIPMFDAAVNQFAAQIEKIHHEYTLSLIHI